MFPTKEDFKRLEEKIDTLQETINRLHARIDGFEGTVTDEVTEVKHKCEKMERHIDFIERVYSNVKSPMGYLVDKVNYMFGRSSSSLPEIENNVATVEPVKPIEQIQQSKIEDVKPVPNDERT